MRGDRRIAGVCTVVWVGRMLDKGILCLDTGHRDSLAQLVLWIDNFIVASIYGNRSEFGLAHRIVLLC